MISVAPGVSASPKRWAVGSGAAVLAIAWGGPLPALAGESFVAHMAMHILVVAVAAPLMALGIAGSRWDPVPAMPGIFAALPAAVIEMVVIWAWHAPVLHEAARTGGGAMVLEQVSFLSAGLLVWLSALGGDRNVQAARTGRAAAGIIGLLLTSMHMTLLGALLSLSPRALYHHSSAGVWGLAPLEDLHLGGVLMLLGGGMVYLAGGMYLLAQVLRGGNRSLP